MLVNITADHGIVRAQASDLCQAALKTAVLLLTSDTSGTRVYLMTFLTLEHLSQEH